MNNMDNINTSIIQSINPNMFNGVITRDVSQQISILKKLLEDNLTNEEVFHGYVNKAYSVWGNNLRDSFIKLIVRYNQLYFIHKQEIIRQQNEMIKMAQDMEEEQLNKTLNSMNISGSKIDNISQMLERTNLSSFF